MLEQFWDDLISVKEACNILQLNNHAVVWRIQSNILRGKRIGGMWVLSRACTEHYALKQRPQRETQAHLDEFWEDLISLKEAGDITQLSDDAMLLRLHKGLIRGRLVGILWVISRASAVEYASTHEHESKHKPGPAPGSEEAKQGGNAVLQRHGREYYQHFAQMGRQAMQQKYGHDFYTRIGLLGGKATKEKYGPGYYQRLGKMNKGKGKRTAEEHNQQEC